MSTNEVTKYRLETQTRNGGWVVSGYYTTADRAKNDAHRLYIHRQCRIVAYKIEVPA